MSASYLRVNDKSYWSVAAVERGLACINVMLRERGLSEHPFVDAFNAALMEDDPDPPREEHETDG